MKLAGRIWCIMSCLMMIKKFSSFIFPVTLLMELCSFSVSRWYDETSCRSEMRPWHFPTISVLRFVSLDNIDFFTINLRALQLRHISCAAIALKHKAVSCCCHDAKLCIVHTYCIPMLFSKTMCHPTSLCKRLPWLLRHHRKRRPCWFRSTSPRCNPAQSRSKYYPHPAQLHIVGRLGGKRSGSICVVCSPNWSGYICLCQLPNFLCHSWKAKQTCFIRPGTCDSNLKLIIFKLISCVCPVKSPSVKG